MESKILRQRNFWYLILIIVVLFVCLILFNWIRDFGGDGRQNIKLEEAQSLVVFPICVPEQLPKNINSDVEISYYLDGGEPKSNTNIYLRYENVSGRKLEIEITEVYTQDPPMDDHEYYDDSERIKVIFLYQLVNPFKLLMMSDDQLEDAIKQMQVQTSINIDRTAWLSSEVVEPEKYRSTMTEWISNNVHYRIFSFLPIEDLNTFTLSMIEQCD